MLDGSCGEGTEADGLLKGMAASTAGAPAKVAEVAGASLSTKAGAMAACNVLATGAAGGDAAAVLPGPFAAGGVDPA